MATIKSFTDIDQSKKLAEILPLERADMSYSFNFDSGIYEISTTPYKSWVVPKYAQPDDGFGQVVPCWSLAALFNVLPDDWWGYNKHYFLEISKMGDMSALYIVSYFRFREQSDGADFGRITHISFQSDNPIDACYEMILNLHEQKLL